MPRIVRVEVGSFTLLRSLFADQQPSLFFGLNRQAQHLYGVPVHEIETLAENAACVVFEDGSKTSVLNLRVDVVKDGVTRTPLERLTRVFAQSYEGRL